MSARLNKKQTSKRVAHISSELLRSKKTPKKVKSIAGSAESQAPLHGGKKTKRGKKK